MALVADLSLVPLAALAGGFLAQRLGQPLMVGYVLAGVSRSIHRRAHGRQPPRHRATCRTRRGVAAVLAQARALVFRELKPVRAVALGGATVQIIVTIALGL